MKNLKNLQFKSQLHVVNLFAQWNNTPVPNRTKPLHEPIFPAVNTTLNKAPHSTISLEILIISIIKLYHNITFLKQQSLSAGTSGLTISYDKALNFS